jgi:hypothetical protein
MKKLLVLAVLVLGMSCHKKNTTPNSVSAPPQSNNSTASTPTITAQEQQMVGDWILDKFEILNTGTVVATTLHSDPAQCHINLFSTAMSPGSTLYYKNFIDGINCTPQNSGWRVVNNIFEPYSFTIHTLTTNSLILQSGSLINGAGYLYYFHK